MSAPNTVTPWSSPCFWLSFCAAALALCGSAFWFEGITKDSEGWHSMFFLMMIAPVLGGGTFLFCLVPSAFLYFKRRRRCDLINLWISGVTVGVILAEALMMEPLRHQIIFGG